jgi:hypothetical protein
LLTQTVGSGGGRLARPEADGGEGEVPGQQDRDSSAHRTDERSKEDTDGEPRRRFGDEAAGDAPVVLAPVGDAPLEPEQRRPGSGEGEHDHHRHRQA